MAMRMVSPVTEPAWRRLAACRYEDMEAFFPAGRPRSTCRQICESCPVRRECRDWALESPWRPSGIFGGLSPAELGAMWDEMHRERQ